jgi:tetratricopeptide (TPR) repeat protein
MATLADARRLLADLRAMQRDEDFTPELLSRLTPYVNQVRGVFAAFASRNPGIAAALWSAIGDVLFYTRALPFSASEYASAVSCADADGDPMLRSHARIIAGRAALEVTEHKRALAAFKSARGLARKHGLRELEGDAVRGIGWCELAAGELERARTEFAKARALHESLQSSRGIADACMAQAVVCRLRGESDEANRLFYRAEALLRVRRDTVRLAKLAELRVTLGLAHADLNVNAAQARVETLLAAGQYWRSALILSRLSDAGSRDRARVLADLAGVPVETFERYVVDLRPDGEKPAWTIAREGSRHVLRAPDGTRRDLTRSGPMLRILTRLASAGGPLAPSEIFAAGWPGERASHQASLHRVYTTVKRIRTLGVPIATAGDGYFAENLERE